MQRLLIFIVLLAIAMPAWAQSRNKTPLLERVITITFEREPLESALKKIARAGDFSFSYNSSLIAGSRQITFAFHNKTVREILEQLFNNSDIVYKERSRYIILTRGEKKKEQASTQPRVLTGYVVDESTGERLKNVSIYDPITLSSTVTDAYGYFQIKIDNPPADQIKLAVNRVNYTDTVVSVVNDQGLLNIPIKIDTEKIAAFADKVGKNLKRFWTHAVLMNLENIDDSLHRRTQASLIPFVGTNHKLSGNVTNDYSFNLLGGYSHGVEKFELGGVFNTVRKDVHGVQIGGGFNAVGGKKDGVQVAGWVNTNLDSAKDVTVAGLLNFNWNTVSGFTMGGLMNFTRHRASGISIAGLANTTLGEHEGVQLAGLYNVVTRSSGPAQVAGLLNFTAGSSRGAQLAGLSNFTAGNMRGGQVAGLLNTTAGSFEGGQVSGLANAAGRNVNGAQVSGLLNVAGGKLTGVQVSALVNYATRVKGTQIGLVNVCDSIDGVPFGFFSFVLKGYHTIEVSADEVYYTNIAFRSGVRKFYNILTAGINPTQSDPIAWYFGYGLGTSPRLSRDWYLNIDLMSNQITPGKVDELQLLNKLYLGAEWQAARKLALTFGATLNVYVADLAAAEDDIFTNFRPHLFANHTYSDGTNVKMWLGAKVGVRFL